MRLAGLLIVVLFGCGDNERELVRACEERSDGSLCIVEGFVGVCRTGVCGSICEGQPDGVSCAAEGFDGVCKLGVCSPGSCGDAIKDPKEHCDDGNTVDSDDCLSTCVNASCGDGFVQAGVETCDDRNVLDTDACVNNCETARCGDSHFYVGVEGCDAGVPWRYCDQQCHPTVPQISAGEDHTCARLASGAVRCWGYGFGGQLGYGNTNTVGDSETPASAGDVPVGGVVIQLAAGRGAHTCAVLATGAVRCWGSGGYGQLGYANTNSIGDNETPASAGDVTIGGSVVSIAVGRGHTCALLTTGAVRCWGAGRGSLGYGDTTYIGDNETPASAGDVPVGGLVVQIVAGTGHTCALLTTGAVRCWGRNDYGILGYAVLLAAIGDDEIPASAGDVPIGGAVTQISAGEYHTCALLDTGRVRCWGAGGWGQLGYGNVNTIGDDETPASAGDVPLGGTVVQISAGYAHTCALLNTGDLQCWGIGSHGQLGYGNINTIGDDETPASAGVVSVGGRVVQVAAGGVHTCALLASGALRCWGMGGNGALGYGNANDIGDTETPASAGDVPVL